MIGVYKITSPSNRIYIGQSVDIERRWFDHKKFNGSIANRLTSSFKRHGTENHVFEVIEECEVGQLNERERYWQDLYDVLGPNGLNLMLTKTDDRSGYCSEELKKRISKSVKKTIENQTPEEKILIHSRKLGIVQSRETVEKRIKKNTGKKRSESFKLRMKILHKDRVHSKVSRENFSQGQLNLYKNGYINPRGIKIINTDTGEIFNSILSLSKVLGINKQTLKNNLEGINKKNKYLNFKYYTNG